MEKKHTIDLLTVSIFGVIFYIVLSTIIELIRRKYALSEEYNFLWMKIIILLIGMVLHELIHGAFAAVYSPNNFKNIKFGISICVAYCVIHESMKVRYFKRVSIMPFIILGVIPLIVGFVLQSFIVVWFGMIFSVGAIGDLIMYYWLYKENGDYYVKEDSNSGKKRLSITIVDSLSDT